MPPDVRHTDHVVDDLVPGMASEVVGADVSLRAWLRAFSFSRARFYLPLAVCTGVSYVLKKGFVSWLVLTGWTLGACVLLLPLSYAVWRHQQLTGNRDD